MTQGTLVKFPRFAISVGFSDKNVFPSRMLASTDGLKMAMASRNGSWRIILKLIFVNKQHDKQFQIPAFLGVPQLIG